MRFEVAGVPVPQGSKTAYVVGRRAVVVDVAGKQLKEWRAAIAAAVDAAVWLPGERELFCDRGTPLVVTAQFRMWRGKTVKRWWPTTTPDLDKLQRAVFDGITDGGGWADDSQVVEVTASKRYGPPGVSVRVEVLEEWETT